MQKKEHKEEKKTEGDEVGKDPNASNIHALPQRTMRKLGVAFQCAAGQTAMEVQVHCAGKQYAAHSKTKKFTIQVPNMKSGC